MLQGSGSAGGRLAPEADTYNYMETRGPNRGVADMWMFTLKSCCQRVAKQQASGELAAEREQLAASVTRKQTQFYEHWLIRPAPRSGRNVFEPRRSLESEIFRTSPPELLH